MPFERWRINQPEDRNAQVRTVVKEYAWQYFIRRGLFTTNCGKRNESWVMNKLAN